MWKWLALGSALYGIAGMLLVAAPPRTPLAPSLAGGTRPDRRDRQMPVERRGQLGDRDGADQNAPDQPDVRWPRRQAQDDGNWPEGTQPNSIDFEGEARPLIISKPPTPFAPASVPGLSTVLQWHPDPATPRNLLALGLSVPANAQTLHVDLRSELATPDQIAEGAPTEDKPVRREPQVFIGLRERGGAIYGQRFPADPTWQSHDLQFSELRLAQFTRDDDDRLDPQQVTAVVIVLHHPPDVPLSSALIELDNIAAH